MRYIIVTCSLKHVTLVLQFCEILLSKPSSNTLVELFCKHTRCIIAEDESGAVIVNNALTNGILTDETTNNVESYHCQTCDISVTGVVPAHMHLIGKAHAKSLSR